MKFINIFIDKIKNLDLKIVRLMKIGLYISFIISLFSIMILFTYETFYSFPILFYIGISLFRTSLSFAVTFFICGIGFDTIAKEISWNLYYVYFCGIINVY